MFVITRRRCCLLFSLRGWCMEIWQPKKVRILLMVVDDDDDGGGGDEDEDDEDDEDDDEDVLSCMETWQPKKVTRWDELFHTLCSFVLRLIKLSMSFISLFLFVWFALLFFSFLLLPSSFFLFLFGFPILSFSVQPLLWWIRWFRYYISLLCLPISSLKRGWCNSHKVINPSFISFSPSLSLSFFPSFLPSFIPFHSFSHIISLLCLPIFSMKWGCCNCHKVIKSFRSFHSSSPLLSSFWASGNPDKNVTAEIDANLTFLSDLLVLAVNLTPLTQFGNLSHGRKAWLWVRIAKNSSSVRTIDIEEEEDLGVLTFADETSLTSLIYGRLFTLTLQLRAGLRLCKKWTVHLRTI